MNGAAAIPNLVKTQLTAALPGKNHDDALFFVLQGSVPASRRIDYANMVSLFTAVELDAVWCGKAFTRLQGVKKATLTQSLTCTMRQASTIVSPVPLRFDQPQQLNKDIQLNEPGRETPLPQYEKAQSVPFTLNLQEDAQNPGQFQLVVNVGSKQQLPNGVPLNLAPSPTSPPSAARDGLKLSPDDRTLYQTQSSSPPTSPLQDKQGWSNLDHVPSEFLQKVVPDWSVSFSRSDSTASTQSKRLADIKARIKKKGRGYVVRLLKGSNAESDEIAEVELGQQLMTQGMTGSYELDSASLPAELSSPPTMIQPSSDSVLGRPDVYEIGTSNEEGVQRPQQSTTPRPFLNGLPSLRHLARDSLARTSVAEDGFSDAETLIPDVRSIDGHIDEVQADFETVSRSLYNLPTRSASVSSIVKTPTRGLSLVGSVRRIEKRNRSRAKTRTASRELERSDAHKSVKHRTGVAKTVFATDVGDAKVQSSILRESIRPISRRSTEHDLMPEKYSTWQYPIRQISAAKPRHSRHTFADDLKVPSSSNTKLRLQTNVVRPKSATTSPISRRKKSPRTYNQASFSPSFIDEDDTNRRSSPEWEEVHHTNQLREALGKVLKLDVPGIDKVDEMKEEHSVPSIVEPDHIGEIPLPSELEIRSTPSSIRSPALMYWGLALSALSEKAYEGFKLLRNTLGTEPPVPQGHVRVRWTCVSCILRLPREASSADILPVMRRIPLRRFHRAATERSPSPRSIFKPPKSAHSP
jgi:hypothetical protein